MTRHLYFAFTFAGLPVAPARLGHDSPLVLEHPDTGCRYSPIAWLRLRSYAK